MADKKVERNPGNIIYIVTIGLKDIGVFNNFPEAFKKFWTEVLKTLEEGTAWQVLETMHWITRISDKIQLPIFFYDARDLAFDIGLLTPSGQPKTPPIINDQPTVDGWQEMVRETFVSVAKSAVMADYKWATKELSEIMATAKELGASIDVINYLQEEINKTVQKGIETCAEVESALAEA